LAFYIRELLGIEDRNELENAPINNIRASKKGKLITRYDVGISIPADVTLLTRCLLPFLFPGKAGVSVNTKIAEALNADEVKGKV
jgi:hypothetical protein